MPGLINCRKEFDAAAPLKGLNINGSLHMTIETGVLILMPVTAAITHEPQNGARPL